MPPSRSKISPAVLAAIGSPAPAGEVPRTRLHTPPRFRPERRSGPVVVARPAALDWTCDACGLTGFGPRVMLDHAEATGHYRYTPREVTC